MNKLAQTNKTNINSSCSCLFVCWLVVSCLGVCLFVCVLVCLFVYLFVCLFRIMCAAILAQESDSWQQKLLGLGGS